MDQKENRFYREASAEPVDGGPAFHVMRDDVAQNDAWGGMTLRDYLAAKAMQGFITGVEDFDEGALADASYRMADAMLRARGSNAPSVDARRMYDALLQIANGATGFLDRDTDLANIAKRALGLPVNE